MSKPLNDIQLHYLRDLEAQIDKLGQQITEKRALMLELLKGRRVRSRGSYFEVERSVPYPSGSGGMRVYFTGPTITKTGAKHSRHRGTAPLSLMEEIE